MSNHVLFDERMRIARQVTAFYDGNAWPADVREAWAKIEARLAAQASTPPTQGSGGGADVTQADREAAAAFYGPHLARPGEVPVTAHMLAGKIDESPLIQAFVRHRLASSNTQGALEAAAKVLNKHPLEWQKELGLPGPAENDTPVSWARFIWQSAIRNLKSGEAGL